MLMHTNPYVVFRPTNGTGNGKLIGCYVRNSTSTQIGNDRAGFKVAMVPYLLKLGYAVRVYEEQGKSGGTLYRRKTALSMLADLESGQLDGVAVADVSRLTRDESGLM